MCRSIRGFGLRVCREQKWDERIPHVARMGDEQRSVGSSMVSVRSRCRALRSPRGDGGSRQEPKLLGRRAADDL